MTTNNNPAQPNVAGVPERIWIDATLHEHDFNSGKRSSAYFLTPDNDTDCVEYVRATLVSRTSGQGKRNDAGDYVGRRHYRHFH
jgi:hypothetical protein